jgi:hypothetical protein
MEKMPENSLKRPGRWTFWPPFRSRWPICDAGAARSPSTGRGALGGSMRQSSLAPWIPRWLLVKIWCNNQQGQLVWIGYNHFLSDQIAVRAQKTWANDWVWVGHQMTQTFRWLNWRGW